MLAVGLRLIDGNDGDLIFDMKRIQITIEVRFVHFNWKIVTLSCERSKANG